MIDLIIGILEQGFMYGVLALGVYISYSILNFPDMTTEGSYPFGAAITAFLILKDINPWITCIIAFGFGMLAGLFTGVVHVKLKVLNLLAGILTMTALWSINIRVAGRSNQSLSNHNTIFNSGIAQMFPKNISTIIIILIVIIAMKILLDLFLKTKAGFLLRATGDNPQMIISLAKDVGGVKILGLGLANGFVALSGSILCQHQRFFDVNMGAGIVVIGLASVILGQTIFKRISFMKATTMVIIGSILYKACISIALNLGMPSSDMKLVTAILFIIALLLNSNIFRGGVKSA